MLLKIQYFTVYSISGPLTPIGPGRDYCIINSFVFCNKCGAGSAIYLSTGAMPPAPLLTSWWHCSSGKTGSTTGK